MAHAVAPQAALETAPLGAPRLADRIRDALRSRHHSRGTEETCCHWVKRFIRFHHVRHPAEMAEPEIHALLTDLAAKAHLKRVKGIHEGDGLER